VHKNEDLGFVIQMDGVYLETPTLFNYSSIIKQINMVHVGQVELKF
jgi:hypothetical protein